MSLILWVILAASVTALVLAIYIIFQALRLWYYEPPGKHYRHIHTPPRGVNDDKIKEPAALD